MELSELRDRITSVFNGSKDDLQDVLRLVEEDQAIFPFNEYERHLIQKGAGGYC